MASLVEPRVQIERDAASARISAANAQYAREVELHASLPQQTIARIDAELARLDSDPDYLGRALVDSSARAQRMALESQRAVAVAAAAKITSLDRLDRAFVGDPASDPVIDATSSDQIPLHDLRAHIEDARARGTPDHVIQEGFFANTHAQAEVAKARAALERLYRDPRWQKKLVAGDPDARAELENLSLRARGREDEPPWSPQL
jgi:hypothetical protein